MLFLFSRPNPRTALAAGIAVAVLAAVGFSRPVGADNVTIVVNGSIVNFDQPPIERSGRVFVPLRGVFERLGASVVYDNGLINATGNGRNIQLHIGSQTAIVNGQQQLIDVAPFLVGARTLVPLRFVSQALGANVDYNGSSRTVTIALGGVVPPPVTTGFSLTNRNPGPGAVVSAKRPSVSAGFSQSVNPNSVRITLDGRDVSATTYVSSNDFLFSPPYDLAPNSHTVRVIGTTQSGTSFDLNWSFTSGASATSNYLRNLLPADGSTVGNTFRVSGQTLPGSTVHIAAQGSAIYGGIFQVTTGTYVADLTAGPQGNFAQDVNLTTASGGAVTVRITSTAPTTQAAASVQLNLHS